MTTHNTKLAVILPVAEKEEFDPQQAHDGDTILADVIETQVEGKEPVLQKRKNASVELETAEQKVVFLKNSIRNLEERIKRNKEDLKERKARLKKLEKLIQQIKDI